MGKKCNIHLTVNEIIIDQLRMKNIQNIILRKLNYPFFERKRILEILNSRNIHVPQKKNTFKFSFSNF